LREQIKNLVSKSGFYKITLRLCLVLVLQGFGYCNLEKVYDKAKNYAEQSLKDAKKVGLDQSQSFTKNNFNVDENNLSAKTSEVMAGHDLASYFAKHQKDIKTFKIDPINDPLFKVSNQIVLDPYKTMEEQLVEESSSSSNEKKDKEEGEIHLCEQLSEERISSCYKNLKVKIKIIPSYQVARWKCGGYREEEHHRCNSRCDGCFYNVFYHPNNSQDCRDCRVMQPALEIPEKIEVISEEWQDDCSILEDLVEKGICHYVEKTCTVSGIQMIDGRAITKDCWQYRQVYSCLASVLPNKKSCESLRLLDCYQIKSECVEYDLSLQGVKDCVKWQQTYFCPKVKKGFKAYKLSNSKSPFCLSGNCHDSSYEHNNELFSVMGQLHLFKQMQDDIKNQVNLFKGQARFCTRHCVNFKDCCGVSIKGWGANLHLASCDESEKELARLRGQKLCVAVGTFCAQKVLGVCIRKKTSFCCFANKLSRIFVEQARNQLGIGWQDAQNPDCNGLSTELLTRVDFSKIDLSEIFTEIQSNLKPKTFDDLNQKIPLERLQNNMEILTSPSLSSDSLKQQEDRRGDL
jgi:Type-1V conjugative transfer system mating pair stabilisation